VPVTQTIELRAGWNWISLNVMPADMSVRAVLGAHPCDDCPGVRSVAPAGPETLRYLSASGEEFVATWDGDPASDWVGSISEFDPARGYQLQVAEASVLTVTGPPTPLSTPIDLTEGTNFIPYLRQGPGSVNGAVPSLGLPGYADGDQLESPAEGTLTTFYTGYGWSGTLLTLQPGRSYKLRVSRAVVASYA